MAIISITTLMHGLVGHVNLVRMRVRVRARVRVRVRIRVRVRVRGHILSSLIPCPLSSTFVSVPEPFPFECLEVSLRLVLFII